MYLPPAYLIAIVTALAGISWIVYARSQTGRFQAKVLPWVSLPFFVVSGIYTWFSFVAVDIELRAAYVRFGFLSIALPQAIILFAISIISRLGHYDNK